jgi:hypothetical protein
MCGFKESCPIGEAAATVSSKGEGGIDADEGFGDTIDEPGMRLSMRLCAYWLGALCARSAISWLRGQGSMCRSGQGENSAFDGKFQENVRNVRLDRCMLLDMEKFPSFQREICPSGTERGGDTLPSSAGL